ncbi:hypothetical protein ABZW18_26080 [Streptomyces sp. NPDC004647]|uniref:hypothetical protein n=1 Tax=Streptomyces sp. NPDC004647 TaxID=3154671 RepID=UPI0033B3B766
MGRITVDTHTLQRLLAHAGETHAVPYQRAFNSLAASHRGKPPGEIVPLLRRAADNARLEFALTDLLEQATAISTGQRYELRINLR